MLISKLLPVYIQGGSRKLEALRDGGEEFDYSQGDECALFLQKRRMSTFNHLFMNAQACWFSHLSISSLQISPAHNLTSSSNNNKDFSKNYNLEFN